MGFVVEGHFKYFMGFPRAVSSVFAQLRIPFAEDPDSLGFHLQKQSS